VFAVVELDHLSWFAQQNRNDAVATSLVSRATGIAVDEHALPPRLLDVEIEVMEVVRQFFSGVSGLAESGQ
jgi:hypothetical protein